MPRDTPPSDWASATWNCVEGGTETLPGKAFPFMEWIPSPNWVVGTCDHYGHLQSTVYVEAIAIREFFSGKHKQSKPASSSYDPCNLQEEVQPSSGCFESRSDFWGKRFFFQRQRPSPHTQALWAGRRGGEETKCATKYNFTECTSPLPGRSWTSVVPVCKSSPKVSATIPLPSAHMRYTWGGVIKYVAAGKWNPENSERKQDNNSRSEGWEPIQSAQLCNHLKDEWQFNSHEIVLWDLRFESKICIVGTSLGCFPACCCKSWSCNCSCCFL